MHQGNNAEPPEPSSSMDKSHSRRWSRLRKYVRNHGHSVHAGFLHGVGTKLGSGAVSLIILWSQTRRDRKSVV